MSTVLEHVLAVTVGTWEVLAMMAPYLLGGFLLAGVLGVFIPATWVERFLGRPGFGPVVTAALVGVPLPLCSCGVLPVAMGIRRHGASRGATVSFLLSTPQTGVDSIAVTWALLGPWVAVYRAVVAFITGLLGGMTVAILDLERRGSVPAASPDVVAAPTAVDRSGNRAVAVLRYGLVTLPKDVALALLLGAVVAGVIGALVPPGWLVVWLGGGVVAMVAMMLVGIPLYVCATASVPIALGFMHAGASVGAAFAFLVAGPATNAATIAAVWRFLGRRTALIYLATVAVVALAGGLLLDVLLPAYLVPQAGQSHAHHSALPWWEHVAGGVLVAVLALAWGSRFLHRKPACGGDGAVILTVTGMTCDHCAAKVRTVLQAIAGVTRVAVDRPAGRVVVDGENLDGPTLCAAVVAAGYAATMAPQECCHA